MIDTSPDNINDTVLHSLFNAVNSKDRKSVNAVVHAIGNINNKLAIKHIVQEPESTREDLDNITFAKMDGIEKVIGKSALKVYLGKYRVKQTSEVQVAKNAIQDAIQSKNSGKDDIVSDILGR